MDRRRGRERRSLGVGTVLTIVVTIAAVLGLAAPRVLAPPSHGLAIHFPTADGLVAGSDVFEAGAKVGTVSSIEPEQRSAKVTVQVEAEHWPLHAGLSADIRPKSLLGEKYVDLHDGAQSTAFTSVDLQAGKDSAPVELDQLINSLDAPTRASTQVLLADLGAGVAGQGPALNQAIAAARADLEHLQVTGTTLQNRDADLDRILLSLDSVLGTITQNDQLSQFGQLIGSANATLTGLETQRLALSRQFVNAQRSLTELNTAVTGTVPALRDLLTIAPTLLASLQQEAGLLALAAGHIANGKDPQGGDLLPDLVSGIARGPTATGGAVEVINGQNYPVFRICLLLPTPQTCAGNGFQHPGPQSVPTSGAGNGSPATLAQFLGS